MIQLDALHLQLGTKVLLNNANLRVFPGQKVGVIGANGSGKSSLFKLLLGDINEDGGSFNIPKAWRLSHMAQEIEGSERCACDYILDGHEQLRRLEQAIAQANHRDDGTALAKLYSQMEAIDGYSAVARAQKLMHGLGFARTDGERSVHDFSGGWRIRLNLARALMCPSDLLLLDEPTNHLDLDATYWLEQWLQTYDGTLLIISHDRDFLDNCVDTIVNIEAQKLDLYSGNYSAFERQKAERLAQQAQAFEKQQARVAEIEAFVRRFKAKASKAKQAQSRVKELERMEKIAPAHIDSPFSFRFMTPEKLPQTLLNLDKVSIGYPAKDNSIQGQAKILAENVELSILASSRIGLLGHNGAGKSTLIKTLAGDLKRLAGTVTSSQHLRIGYFAQHQLEALDLEASCALHIQRLSPTTTEQEIRTFLGSFGFHGDRVFEAIRHFSGGEKSRLALALVTWQKPNLLIMDEPTNHLDLEMRHALTVALQEFDGAIILVSHDRHLLRNTVDDFYLVDSGYVQAFDGNIEDYQQWLAKQSYDTSNGSNSPDNATDIKRDKKQDRQAAAALREKLKPFTQVLKKLEQAIEKNSQKLADIEHQLSDSTLYDGDNDKLAHLLKAQGEIKKQLDADEEQWLEKSGELEELSSQSE